MSKKIKIAFFIDTIDTNIGGTERQVLILLKNLNKNKFLPHLVCFKDSQWLQAHSDQWFIRIFPIHTFFSITFLLSLFKIVTYLKNERIEIVQTHFRDSNIIGILAAKLAGVNYILSTRRNCGFWHNWKELALLKFLNPMVTGFLANCEACKQHTVDIEGISQKRISVIYNGFEDIFNAKSLSMDEKNTIKQQYSILNNEKTVILVSNLRDIKRVDVFIRAAKIITVTKCRVNFLIAGKGDIDHEKELKEYSQSLGVSKHMHFLGHRSDIHTLLKVCDIGVLCSDSEGLSNSIMEYMASGLPVVCTDVGGNNELVVDALNGYLTKPGDPHDLAQKIMVILNDSQMVETMGKESLSRVQKLFSFDSLMTNTEKYYEKIMEIN